MVKQNYRYWVLWRCPTVRFLDYQKVKDAERQKAKELFGTAEAPTELASRVSQARARCEFFFSDCFQMSSMLTETAAAADNGHQEQDV